MKTPPIPVLGVLVYNRGDLLTRLVQSLDYPIEKLVILDNAVDESIVAANDFARNHHPNVVIHNPGFNQPKPVNLGFSGGWNYILRRHVEDWILMVGSDVQFMPGQLEKIAQHYERMKDRTPPVGMINTNYGWNVQGFTRAALENIGYLDENFYPLYYEDCDYNWRHTVARRLGLLSFPDDGECTIHVHHDQSSTSRNLSPEKAQRMAQAFERNMQYHIRKWGGAQLHEKWEHPFNDPSRSIREWALEPGRWELNSLD